MISRYLKIGKVLFCNKLEDLVNLWQIFLIDFSEVKFTIIVEQAISHLKILHK